MGLEHPPGRAQAGDHKRFALWRSKVPFPEDSVWGEKQGCSCRNVIGCFLCWKGLFRWMERLEKEKADKEDVELGMDEVQPQGA